MQLESLKNFQSLIKSTITCNTKGEGKTQCVSYDKEKEALKIWAVCVEGYRGAALKCLKCQLNGKDQQWENTSEIETGF